MGRRRTRSASEKPKQRKIASIFRHAVEAAPGRSVCARCVPGSRCLAAEPSLARLPMRAMRQPTQPVNALGAVVRISVAVTVDAIGQ